MLSVRLRTETRSHHERLESHINYLQPGIGRAAYADLLTRLYGFYHPLELRISQFLSPTFPSLMEGRRKSGWLLKDLSSLGCPFPEASSLCRDLPRIHDTGSALGAAYVLEGSTLGGGIMSRHFSATIGVSPEAGAAFFASYGERIPVMWRQFLHTLDDWGVRNNGDGAIRAAAETFDRLGTWLMGRPST